MKTGLYLTPVILFFTLSITTEADQSDILVDTDLGRIKGTTLTSRLGREFYAFRGISYAKSPVGERRFKAPEPVDPWDDVFDATTDGPMCPQPTDEPSDVSEDCLRLNVYTPSYQGNTSLPVIVYIHPGGFYGLSGQSKNFAGPQSMMDRDVVFVTMNYRLASLGFLSTGTVDAPGNAGLKDQAAALKWIQAHIHKFGGNPQSVTLVGYSAGGWSVGLHMVSPMSRGLFHKAVLMSGAATAQWDVPSHQLHLARKQAGILNCSDASVRDMMDCFKTKTSSDFGNSLYSMFEYAGGSPILLWSPVIEPDFGQERFLTENPTKAYQEGRFMKIPIIVGITKDEFAGVAVEVLTNATLRQDMDVRFREVAPICFLYERNTTRSENISDQLREFYLGSGPFDENDSLDGLAKLFSDSVIGFGAHRYAHLASQFTDVYYYRFSFQGRYSHVNYPGDKPYGVVHHDDLLYMIVAPAVAPMFTPNDPEHVMVERLTRMWSNFAASGCPTNETDEFLNGVRWVPFNVHKKLYLDIGSDLVMKTSLYEDRYSKWDELFPLE